MKNNRKPGHTSVPVFSMIVKPLGVCYNNTGGMQYGFEINSVGGPGPG